VEQLLILENAMNTQISTKIGAFVVALMMNTVIFGSVAYLFSTPVQAQSEQACSLPTIYVSSAVA
jgi:hypothetical protein